MSPVMATRYRGRTAGTMQSQAEVVRAPRSGKGGASAVNAEVDSARDALESHNLCTPIMG